MHRANPYRRSSIWHPSSALRVLLGLFVATFALHGASCSGDVQDKRTTTGSTASSTSSTSSSSSGDGGAASSSSGTGGNNGSGGSGGMGTSGNPVDGGGPVEYLGYNLFTHVPRFVIFKVDHARNLCFRIMMEGFLGPGPLGIDVTANWAATNALVTNDVADCVMSMGFPPQPMTFSNATGGAGKIVISGGFPCSVDMHMTLTFDPIAPWVPTSEAFDVDMLNIDGGCG